MHIDIYICIPWWVACRLHVAPCLNPFWSTYRVDAGSISPFQTPITIPKQDRFPPHLEKLNVASSRDMVLLSNSLMDWLIKRRDILVHAKFGGNGDIFCIEKETWKGNVDFPIDGAVCCGCRYINICKKNRMEVDRFIYLY